MKSGRHTVPQHLLDTTIADGATDNHQRKQQPIVLFMTPLEQLFHESERCAMYGRPLLQIYPEVVKDERNSLGQPRHAENLVNHSTPGIQLLPHREYCVTIEKSQQSSFGKYSLFILRNERNL